MFDFIRSHNKLLQFILLLLIFPAFVFVGVDSYSSFMDDSGVVAEVGDAKIATQELDASLRESAERMQRMMGGQSIDLKMFDTAEARKTALDGLVTQKLIANETNKQRIQVTDDRLRDELLSIPDLQKDGKFDFEKYKLIASSRGLSVEGLDAQIRRDLMLQTIPSGLNGSAIAPKKVAEMITAAQLQKRTVEELVFKPSDYVSQVKVTDEAVAKFYEANGRLFDVPETVDVEYVVLDADAAGAQIKLPEDDVKTYYEQNKAKWGTPEQRRSRHILIAVDAKAADADKQQAKKKAQDLLEKLKKTPDDFAKLAKEFSADPGSAASGGDLGFNAKGVMVGAFDAAVFGMKEGQLSDVVETDFGYHIIQVTGIRGGASKPFEQVRGEIEVELRKQLASKKFAELAETFSNMVYEQSDSFKPVADKLGLKVQRVDGMGRAGGKGPFANPKLMSAVFSSDSISGKRNTEAVEVAASTLVSARVVNHYPTKRKPLADVTDEVRGRVIVEQSTKLAREAGEAALKAAKEGKAPTGFAAAKTVSRDAASGLSPEAVQALFKADVSKLPTVAGVDLGPRGYGLYRITEVSGPSKDAEVFKTKLAADSNVLANMLGRQAFDSALEAIRQRTGVTVHQARIGGTTAKAE